MINTNFEPFPELITDRLVLRQLTPDDENEIFAIRSNESIAKYLDRPLCESVGGARAFIEKINRGIKHGEWIYWGIVLNSNPNIIGTICLWNLSIDRSSAEVGFELLLGYQGKGFMNEALSKVIEFGFSTMNLMAIDGEVDPDNTKSINLMKKYNFIKSARISDEEIPNASTVIYRLYREKFDQTLRR